MNLVLASSSHDRFVALAGSVTGRDHLWAHRDGQDGFALVAKPDVTAVIVTDGCSSGRQSEVGARLGARMPQQLLGRAFAFVLVAVGTYIFLTAALIGA